MRHKKHTDDGGGVNLGIIITPMLDMAFQLMAFFIMTYHPSALEGHIDGSLLPPAKVLHKGEKATADPLELPSENEEPEVNEMVMVTVKAVGKGKIEGTRHEGEPSRILLKRPEAPSPETVSDTDIPLEKGLEKLGTELKNLLKDPTANKTKIKLEADGDLKHEYVMRVYDVCKLAGFHNISFVAPPPNLGGGN